MHNNIEFLESASNLRGAIYKNTGRRLSFKRTNEIIACLQQGRLFFKSARDAELEIQPLLLYYGIVGYSKAIVLSRTDNDINGFKYHGVGMSKEPPKNIGDSLVLFKGAGTFFNDPNV